MTSPCRNGCRYVNISMCHHAFFFFIPTITMVWIFCRLCAYVEPIDVHWFPIGYAESEQLLIITRAFTLQHMVCFKNGFSLHIQAYTSPRLNVMYSITASKWLIFCKNNRSIGRVFMESAHDHKVSMLCWQNNRRVMLIYLRVWWKVSVFALWYISPLLFHI